MDSMDPIEQYRANKKAMQEQLMAVDQGTLKPFFTSLFETHPTLQVVRWNQFTPHFNDGDPCVFRVNGPEVCEKTLTDMSDEEREAHDEGPWISAWSGKAYPLYEAAKDVVLFFNGIDAVLNVAFGDGVQVTVLRNGEIVVNDYYHD